MCLSPKKELHNRQSRCTTADPDKNGKPCAISVQVPHGADGELKTINIPVITLGPHDGMANKEVRH